MGWDGMEGRARCRSQGTRFHSYRISCEGLMNSMVAIGNVIVYLKAFQGDQFSSVAQSCPTLCNPVDCSMEGLPVHHHLPEFTKRIDLKLNLLTLNSHTDTQTHTGNYVETIDKLFNLIELIFL